LNWIKQWWVLTVVTPAAFGDSNHFEKTAAAAAAAADFYFFGWGGYGAMRGSFVGASLVFHGFIFYRSGGLTPPIPS
jgi:hypothetical protein